MFELCEPHIRCVGQESNHSTQVPGLLSSVLSNFILKLKTSRGEPVFCWNLRKEKLDTVLLPGSEEVRGYTASALVPTGGTPGLVLGSSFGGTFGSLPSFPQLCWLPLACQSVHVFQFMPVVSFNCLIVALCFLFGGKGQASSADYSPLDLILTYCKDFRKKKWMNWGNRS